MPTSNELLERAEQWGELGKWSGRLDSNQRPPAPKAGALPGCATPRRTHYGVQISDPVYRPFSSCAR